MYGSKATEDVISEWNKLASDVIRALELAGLAVSQTSDSGDDAGPEVAVDLSGDEEGGVFVKWKVSTPLSKSVAQRVMTGELDNDDVRHYGVISTEMHSALMTIITSAGFYAIDASDDMDPFTIRVERADGEGLSPS
ncbi:hypothetical protein [Streptomyces sp. NPDC049813]|uniref:hypothetical protein n=1 Tax=Streptomyces sp. NPDC049813 TaxID=3365597 RepID=UPI0037A87FAB